MARPTYITGIGHPTEAQTTTVEREGIASRWRAHRAARKTAHLVSPRHRRVLARWARRTANGATDPDPLARRRAPLLDYRAAPVRTELLEIAALIEHSCNPDAARVAALRNLLANGCDSPLYNPDIHISELHATLDYIRSGL